MHLDYDYVEDKSDDDLEVEADPCPRGFQKIVELTHENLGDNVKKSDATQGHFQRERVLDWLVVPSLVQNHDQKRVQKAPKNAYDRRNNERVDRLVVKLHLAEGKGAQVGEKSRQETQSHPESFIRDIFVCVGFLARVRH